MIEIAQVAFATLLIYLIFLAATSNNGDPDASA